VSIFQFVENADQGEDERSIAAHVAMLAVQAAKKDPDTAVISARMEKTYADRRAMVYNGISTQDIMCKYPTLKFTDQVRMCFVSVHSVIFMSTNVDKFQFLCCNLSTFVHTYKHDQIFSEYCEQLL